MHDQTQYRRPKPDIPKTYTPKPYTPEPYTPEPYKPKIYEHSKAELNTRPLRLVDTKPAQRNFHHQFNEDTEFGFEEELKKFNFENQKALQESKVDNNGGRSRYPNQNFPTELKVESRENTFDDIKAPNLKTIFDQNPMFANEEFQQSFEPERFSFVETNKESSKKKRNFSPPALTEKFRSPLKESHSYPFLDSSIDIDRINNKQRKVKPFTNFKMVEKSKEIRTRKPTADVKTFSNFETFQEIPKIQTHQTAVTKSPPAQTSYENLPTFTHFKSKPSFSNFKAKPTKLSSTPRKPSKTTTTYSPSVKTLDELPTFANFKTVNSSPKTFLLHSKKPSEPTSKPFPSFINFKPQSEQTSEPETQARTDYKAYESEATTVKSTEQPAPTQPTTKKPYNYQKKNFREPLKQVMKNSGEHQIIRIKTKQEAARARPQPKQLDIPQSGFQPIAGPRPQPGRLEIQEVNRRQGVYQPSDVIYDNDQPLLTLDSVKPFRARSNPDSFAIDVKASFNPKPKQENKRPQRLQKRLMRLPNSKFSHLLHRRPVKSNKVAVAQ